MRMDMRALGFHVARDGPAYTAVMRAAASLAQTPSAARQSRPSLSRRTDPNMIYKCGHR